MGSVAGIGLSYRAKLAVFFEEEQSPTGGHGIDFAEVIAENLRYDDLPPQVSELVARGLPIVPHGVSLGLAGAEMPDPARLRRLAELTQALRAPLVSEHVAFVRASPPSRQRSAALLHSSGTPSAPVPVGARGLASHLSGSAGTGMAHGDVVEAGHLIPPPRTWESLAVLVDNVRRAQDQLPVPLALENIAANLRWPEDELDEPDFLAELVAATGCLLLVDVANLFGSALARGSDPFGELGRLPWESVAYAHVAGGQIRDGLYLDTHGGPVLEPVAALVAEAVTRRRSASVAGGPSGLGVLLEVDQGFDAAEVERNLALVREAMSRQSVAL